MIFANGHKYFKSLEQKLKKRYNYKKKKIHSGLVCYSKSVALKTNNRCWYCGIFLLTIQDVRNEKYKEIYSQIEKSAVKKHLRFTHDHLIPRSQGGTNRRENLILACNWCNSRRDTKSLEQFRQWVLDGCVDVCGEKRMPLKKIPRLWIITKDSVTFYGEMLA